MCMLTYYPANVTPDTGALTNGAYYNDDGHGFAIVDRNRIIVRRSMDAERMVAEFARFRKKYPSGPALFHSRFATHGTKGKANCHPFKVGGDRRTVLAHNGILPKSVQPGKGDRRSDTRITAEDFLPRVPFGWLGTRRSRDRFARWMTPANKIVILTVDPRYRENSYLVNEDSGIWEDDIWYSNGDYACKPWALDDDTDDDADTPAYASWWNNIADTACGHCHTIGFIDPESGYCTLCATCADCGEFARGCLCYVPSKMVGTRKES